jgi:hypothetical protein
MWELYNIFEGSYNVAVKKLSDLWNAMEFSRLPVTRNLYL